MILLDSSITALTIWGYQMSWLELTGTVFNISTVYLITRRKVINWPIGIVASVMFALLFFQFRLYSDFIENIYYIATGFWGWWLWTRKSAQDGSEVLVRTATRREMFVTFAVITLGTAVMGYCITNVHSWLPKYFPEAASLPYLDTLTTVMSFAAQILITRRILLNWYLWIVVDIIGIWLYWYKGLKLISLLYFVFLILATKGLIDWRAQLVRQTESQKGVA